MQQVKEYLAQARYLDADINSRQQELDMTRKNLTSLQAVELKEDIVQSSRSGEEKAMKKDIEWLKDKIFLRRKYLAKLLLEGEESTFTERELKALKGVLGLIDQLDEPEVLSQEWISDNAVVGQYPDGMGHVVPAYKLQSLLVPKQEELETKILELIESYKQEEGAYSNPENGWIGGFIEDLKNLVEKEQKYYILGKYDTPILFRDYRNRITETSNLSDIYPKANSEDFEFTEQEIKDYDPRYWAFAEPVE